MKCLLGTGILNWNFWETQSNRYGTVFLSTDIIEKTPVKLNQEHKDTLGKLYALVKETRESYSAGNPERKLVPVKPNVGEEFFLGDGALIFDHENVVGMEPLDCRERDWLNPEILYKLHYQTVDLLFEPLAR